MNAVQHRQNVRIAGRIHSMRVQPWGGAPTLEVSVGDETGTMTVVFAGRRQIGGRCRVAADLGGDLLAGHTRIRTRQDDLAAHCQVLCRGMSTRPTLQLSTFGPGENDLNSWSSSFGHGVPFDTGGCTSKNAPSTRKFPDLKHFLMNQPDRTLVVCRRNGGGADSRRDAPRSAVMALVASVRTGNELRDEGPNPVVVVAEPIERREELLP